MTLHWWMHWFWITYQLIFYISSVQSKPITYASITHLEIDVNHSRPLRRIEKSIGQSPQTKSQIPILLPFPATSDTSDTSVGDILPQLYRTKVNITLNRILCTNPSNLNNNSNSTLGNGTRFVCNRNYSDNEQLFNDGNSMNNENANISDTTLANFQSENDFTTEKNYTEDVSFNVTVTSVIAKKEHISAGHENVSTPTVLSSMSITGICFGIVVIISAVSAVSFMLYRRRYVNKPQTLNDKCSNPDSSGYIDDSSMRENSEEMYSLDNDSFLNSLEAMTIQNYWTDNVKHTKL